MVRYVIHQPARAALVVLALSATASRLLSLERTQAGKAEKSDSQVKVAATSGKPDSSGTQLLTITVDINKGWHIYANPTDHEVLDGAKTVVTVQSNGKPLRAKVDYPPGT